LSQIRREHTTVSDREFSERTAAVAAAVRLGPAGPVGAALGIVLAAGSAAGARRLQHPLLLAARALSEELGRHAGRSVSA
jgi:DNA-binding IclR family transcriptional regulator